MKALTSQQIFDWAYTRIVAQGYPARDKASRYCRYFDPATGHRCAAGILLSKKDARKVEQILAGKAPSFDRLPHAAMKFFVDAGVADSDFVLELQEAHDAASYYGTKKNFLREFKKRMQEVAVRYNLIIPRKVSK